MKYHTPYRLSLMEDSRIDTVVKQLLEKNGLPAKFNRFNGDGTEWHPDLASRYLKRTKFFLDTNFTLRIPNPDNRRRKCIGPMITVRFHRVATLCERTLCGVHPNSPTSTTGVVSNKPRSGTCLMNAVYAMSKIGRNKLFSFGILF